VTISFSNNILHHGVSVMIQLCTPRMKLKRVIQLDH